MTTLHVNSDILDAQVGKVDEAADLESVSYPAAPDVGRSTSSVSTAISRLSSKASGAASSARSTASSLRGAATSFRNTDASVASSTPGGSHGHP